MPQISVKLASVEEEKQAVEARLQVELAQERQEHRMAREAAELKLGDLEIRLRQSSASEGAPTPAGKQPPAMAAPGRVLRPDLRVLHSHNHAMQQMPRM